MEKTEKIIEKLKAVFIKQKNMNAEYSKAILKAKSELQDAYRNFNEVTEDGYMDLAILNLNVAKKKYELCLSEAKEIFHKNMAS